MAITPEGDRLRKAIAWISDQKTYTLATIEEASQRFDLSPNEEDFLIHHFIQQKPDRHEEQTHTKDVK